jgi:hypothetical protein
MKIKETLIKTPSTVVTPAGDNPFTAYANAALAHNLTGTLLKFTKGDYLAGQDGREIAVGTRLIANMDSYAIGWVRWSNGRPTEQLMGRVVDCFKPARRNELGDNESDLWETSENGAPRDPWQFTNNLVLADPENGELFTFSTSSLGGRKAVEKLCQLYGRELARHRKEWPVIELQVESYQHSNKGYGRIKDPIFKIVNWIAKDDGSPAGPTAHGPAPNPTPAMHAASRSHMVEPPPDETGDPGNDGMCF